VLWFLWNLLIFNDPFYFIFGPFSAHAQQQQIFEAGELLTKGNLVFSFLVYLYAVFYNTYTTIAILGFLGMVLFWKDKQIPGNIKVASLVLLAPLVFNVLALYFGHSVLFVEGLFPYTWFNVRYGMMLIPTIAIFCGYLIEKSGALKWIIISIIGFTISVSYNGKDIVTIDDALIGASGKNVAEVSTWLRGNVSGEQGYVLISAASHDAIIFSSGLPMKSFIHEGTGKYWENAVENPDKWAKWIVMRTNDTSDWTFREISDAPGFANFELVDHYPFADIYQLKKDYWGSVITTPVIGKQK